MMVMMTKNTFPVVEAQDAIHHNGFMMIKIEIIIVTRMTRMVLIPILIGMMMMMMMQ